MVRDEIVARHSSPTRALWREPLFWMAGALVLTAFAVGGTWVASQLHAANRACTKGDTRGPCIAAAQNAAGIASANARLTEHNLPPVPTPTSVPTVPTVTQTVTQAPVPPSQASIELAVAMYCARTTCGSGPTAAQVARAVSTYCTLNGKCQGPAGKSGVSGSPGSIGASGASGSNGTNGSDGASVTPDQVAQAVTNYCAAQSGGTCKGEPGTNGKDGAPGSPPADFTFTIPGVAPALDTTYLCTPDTAPDPGTTPHYTCKPE